MKLWFDSYKKSYPEDLNDKGEVYKAVISEFIATALFVFLGCGSVVAAKATPGFSGPQIIMPISMTFGISIMCLAYSLGVYSGGHINPAVTFFLLLMKEISPRRSAMYIVAQFTGAVVGALILFAGTSGLSHQEEVGSPPYSLGVNVLNEYMTETNGFVMELMGTFLLCFVVYQTCFHPGGPSDGSPNLAPLVIGFTVFLAHAVLVPLTGCGINPARSFGPSLVNSFANNDTWKQYTWIYYIGPMVGSILCAFVINAIYVEEDDEKKSKAKTSAIDGDQRL